MKLTGARVFVVKTPPPHLGGPTWYFVKLMTDEGIVGYGETALLAGLERLEGGFARLMLDIFEKFLKGKDPLRREALYAAMYARLCWQHPDYFMGGLISALDTALWDIAGKALGVPVWQMLGGKFRDRVRAYSYISHPDPEKQRRAGWTRSPEGVAELAGFMVREEGFTAVKFDPLTMVNDQGNPLPPWQLGREELRRAERTVRLIREAVGDEADILIGTHGQTSPSAALRLAKRLEPYDPLWFEEPVPPENPEEMRKVLQGTTIPIATGERLCTVHDYHRLLQAGGAAILQPDAGCCGGITQLYKIARQAEPYFAQVAPHVWGGPIITAAALQIDAVIPNFLIQESIYDSRGFFDRILKAPFVWDKGYLLPPEGPGLGVELCEKGMRPYLAGEVEG